MEAGESLEEGLTREVMEETGLEIEIIAPVSTWCVPNHMIGVAFICDYVSGQVRLTPEHTEFKWIPVKEYLKLMKNSPSIDNFRRHLEWRSRVT